jgi:hypothetical protein
LHRQSAEPYGALVTDGEIGLLVAAAAVAVFVVLGVVGWFVFGVDLSENPVAGLAVVVAILALVTSSHEWDRLWQQQVEGKVCDTAYPDFCTDRHPAARDLDCQDVDETDFEVRETRCLAHRFRRYPAPSKP